MQRFVSVREASAHYGLSETEVRRRIADGRLIAERLTRPQGTMLRVMIDTPDETPTPATDAPNAHQDTPPRADSEETLGVIKALIHSHADTVARQGEMIAELREERGRLQAERDAAVARAERAEGLAELLDNANDTERARAEKAEEELSHLRIDVRRAERQAEQAQHVADAQEQRANDLCRQLEQLRRPWWKWWKRWR